MKRMDMLRRLLLFALAAILVPVCCFGESGDAASSDVTFRDIPWGADYNTVMNSITGMSLKTYSGFPGTTVQKALLDGEDTFTYNTQFTAQAKNPGISVGGHPITNISLFFAYTKNVNGEITCENKDSVFYKGVYYIEVKDDDTLERWGSEYSQKLTSIYGKPVQTMQDWPTPFSAKIDYTVWKKGDVYVVLKTHSNLNLLADSEYFILISYAWEGADALLSEAETLQKNATMKDTDGL